MRQGERRSQLVGRRGGTYNAQGLLLPTCALTPGLMVRVSQLLDFGRNLLRRRSFGNLRYEVQFIERRHPRARTLWDQGTEALRLRMVCRLEVRLEVGDTADLEICATRYGSSERRLARARISGTKEPKP